MNKPTINSTIYISGPMTGYPNYNYSAFFTAEARLREKYQCAVINPARNFDGDQTLPWETYMRKDIQQVCTSSHICTLDGWQNSKGANIEVNVAKTIGCEIMSLRELMSEAPAEKRIIGIIGRKGSGKSEVAKYLAMAGYNVLPFAATVKRICKELGFPDEYIYGSKKEEIYEPLGVTGRWAMQSAGTEWGRICLGKDIWVKINVNKIIASEQSVVVDDCRFENEVAAIQKLGGKIIKVSRAANSLVSDGHASEREFDLLPFDYEIKNDGSIDELHAAIDEIIK